MKLEIERTENKNEELEINGTIKLNDTDKENIENVFKMLEQIETIGEKTYVDKLFIDSETYDRLENIKYKLDYILYDIIQPKEE